MQSFIELEKARHISHFINPVLGIMLLLFASKRAALIEGGLKIFLLRVLAAALSLWILTSLDKPIKVLRHAAWFPSGHMAFAVCIATAMVFLDRRTLAPMALVTLLYAALMVVMKYHTPLELFTATLIAIGVTWLFLKRATKAENAVGKPRD